MRSSELQQIIFFQKASGGGKKKKEKGQKKKDKKAKKAKKQLDKTIDFEIMEGMSKADKKAYKKQKKQRALEMANGEFDQEQNKNDSLRLFVFKIFCVGEKIGQ